MPVVLIALGSNVGDRPSYLQRATCELAHFVDVVAASHVYETEPMYVEDQPPYLNAAVRAETNLSPRVLLRRLKEIEALIGRTPQSRNGPREVDLDLVAYGSLAYRFVELKRTRLVVPHPRTFERRFVLEPLNDIAPELVLPGVGVVRELLAQTEDQAASVRRSEYALLPI